MNGWTNTAKISIKKKNSLQAPGQILICKDRKKPRRAFWPDPHTLRVEKGQPPVPLGTAL